MENIKRIEIVDLFKETIKETIGQEICVKGWVRTKRGNKSVAFIALNDGSTIKNIQIVA
ncbi:MAG: asparagine--tRNA ligase, partial [Bacteroidales bacterium]|nr:asparagine--tRNA ligase [Bacteroidales bacterium]